MSDNIGDNIIPVTAIMPGGDETPGERYERQLDVCFLVEWSHAHGNLDGVRNVKDHPKLVRAMRKDMEARDAGLAERLRERADNRGSRSSPARRATRRAAGDGRIDYGARKAPFL
jgi:hypothetical protein